MLNQGSLRNQEISTFPTPEQPLMIRGEKLFFCQFYILKVWFLNLRYFKLIEFVSFVSSLSTLATLTQLLNQLFNRKMQEQKSLPQFTPTDTQINTFLQSVQSKKISEEQYQRLLKFKQNFDRINAQNRNENLKNLQILHAKPYSQQLNPRDSLCYNCYQQVPKMSKIWCRICGQTMCDRCLVRIRKVENGEQIKFCQKCDQKYLKAMLFKKQYKKESIRRKAAQIIVKQYEMLQKIMEIQKQKVKANGEERSNKLLQTVQYIKQLKVQHKQIKGEIEQIKNKITFGKEIETGLKKKLYNLRLDYGDNMNSSYGTEIQSYIQPPRADSEQEVSVKDRNINESMVNSFLEESKGNTQVQQIDQRKCDCIIY